MSSEPLDVGKEIESVCDQYRQGTISREKAEYKISEIYPPQPEEKKQKFLKALDSGKVKTMGHKAFALIPDWARRRLDEIDDVKAGKTPAEDTAVVPWQTGAASQPVGGDAGEEGDAGDFEEPEEDADEEDNGEE